MSVVESRETRPLEERVHAIVFDPEEDRTRQEFKADSSMDRLVAKWLAGEAPTPRWTAANYGDFTMEVTVQDAFDKVESLNEAFAELPSETRKELDHDPRKLVELVQELAANPDDEHLVERARRLNVLKEKATEVQAGASATGEVSPSPSPPAGEQPPAGQPPAEGG